MFAVQVQISEEALTPRMNEMRDWLDHHRVQPATFRYTFDPPGLAFLVSFEAEADALMFAERFEGQLVKALDPPSPGLANSR